MRWPRAADARTPIGVKIMDRRIELASRHRLATVEKLAPRVFREVINRTYADCLVTDESDLSDFVDVSGDREAQVAALLDRFRTHYSIGSQPLGSTRIVDLLELLASRGVQR